jgi:hypothetical protein
MRKSASYLFRWLRRITFPLPLTLEEEKMEEVKIRSPSFDPIETNACGRFDRFDPDQSIEASLYVRSRAKPAPCVEARAPEMSAQLCVRLAMFP